MAFPHKHILTEEQHSAQHLTGSPPRNGLDPELTARLRGLGSRVRKSVTEGYSTATPFSLNGQPLKAKLPFTKSLSFVSANDALRDAYSSRSDPFFASAPREKRKRAVPDGEDKEAMSDVDVDMDSDSGGGDTNPEASRSDVLPRPIIPLRTAGRGTTRSLPVGIFQFSDGSRAPSNSHASTLAQTEEEDWSQESFTSSFGAPRT